MKIESHIRMGQRVWEFPLESLPARATKRAGKAAGVVIMAFGLFWVGFVLFSIFDIHQQRVDLPLALLALLFASLGCVIFAFGLHQYRWEQHIEIDGDIVWVKQRGLRGWTEWHAALQDFAGVVKYRKVVRRKKRTHSYYLIDLKHPEAKKTLNLYYSGSEADLRKKWEHYARTLGVPALEETAEGVISRAVDDLDKPISDLIREQKVSVDYDALRSKAKGLAVDIDGDSMTLTRTGMAHPWWGHLIFIGAPLVILYPLLFLTGDKDFGVWFGTLFLVSILGVAFYALLHDLTHRDRLTIDARELRLSEITKNGEKPGATRALAEIEGVAIKVRTSQQPAHVVIATDRGDLKFGGYLPVKSLDFVVNAILAKIERQDERAE